MRVKLHAGKKAIVVVQIFVQLYVPSILLHIYFVQLKPVVAHLE